MHDRQPPWEGHTFVFIGGLHRSGTSQLNETLATHPDVSGFANTGVPHDEGQHLQDVFPTARAYGGPGRFAFDARARLTESSPLAHYGSAERLFRQWSPHWQLERRVLVEKSPPNLIRARFLQQLFPGARFVIAVRHPLITALATSKLATTKAMRRTLRRPPFLDLLRHWVVAHRLFLEDLPRIEHVCIVRWEELCADPEAVLRTIGAFMGVEQRFTMPALDPTVDDRYLAEWSERLRATGRANLRFRRLLDSIYSFEPEANQFGYSLREPNASMPLDLTQAL